MTIDTTPARARDRRRTATTALLEALLLVIGVITLVVAPTLSQARAATSVTGIASGGSILYVKAYNVWLSSPDGVTVRQLTTDGTASAPYRNPSQSDDGNVIVAVRDRNEQAGGFVRSYLTEMNRSGVPLRAPFAPTQYATRLGGSCTIPVLEAPGGILATVSPDGTKIAVNPQGTFYDFDCGGTFESSMYVITVAGAAVGSTITTSGTENLEQPEWLGSTRLLMYGEFANGDFYYDLGASTAQQWIAPAWGDFTDNAYEYPAVAGSFLATAGWDASGNRAVRFRTMNGAPPAAPTFRCDIATGNPYAVGYAPHVAPDGTAVVWGEHDENVSPAVDGVYISPLGSAASGNCSSLQRQLLVAGGSDPFWGPAGTIPASPPALSVNDVSVSEGNSGTKSATFTITRTGSTTGTSTVSYATANGTATAGSDYTAVGPTTLTFAAGETTKSVTVSVLGDAVVEPNETFSLLLSSPAGATVSDGTGVATITNDDTAPPTTGPAYAQVNDVRVMEGNSGVSLATFTVTRSGNTTGTSSLKYATSSGSALGGSDFAMVPSTTMAFAAGETAKSVTVSVLRDTVPEGDETFTLGLSSPVGVTLSDAVGTGTIANDDAPAYLSVRDVTTTEGNSGTHVVNFTITRSGNTTVPATVKYATSSATATAPADYTAVPLTTLTFAVGETTKTVAVSVVGDTTAEANESFRLSLSSPVGAAMSDNISTATIANDDGTATPGPATWLAISDGSRSEGNSGTALETFTVIRYGNTTGTSSVKYATSNGTAVSGSDYTAVPWTLITFAAGQTSTTVSVSVLGDTVPEATEVFNVGLSAVTGAVLADSAGIGTIVNDDAPTYLRVNDLSVSEGNSGSKLITFTIKRSGNTTVGSSVKYATANSTALAGSDYTAVPATLVSFLAGETSKSVTVSVLGDTTVEPNETFSLVLSAPVGAFVSDTTGVATLVNDD
ncbi:MAG: large repetitive protein [Actinomycetota bacterium]|nr:large repetitive protein [Actinomycetota bacterium]